MEYSTTHRRRLYVIFDIHLTFFYRTKLSWHVQNDFLIKLNISRSAFFLKVTFHFQFLEAVVGLLKSDLFTLVGYNFVRKNFKNKNQMTVGKRFSRASKWDHPRFFFFFGLEVTAFPRYTTLWWLLDLRHSDHFTLVGFSSIFPICPNPPCLSQSTPSVPIHHRQCADQLMLELTGLKTWVMWDRSGWKH